MKKKKRIYIIPNRYGMTYYLGVISMIMIGATYANNLVFLLAFTLFSLGIMIMIQTNEQLKKVSFEKVILTHGYANEIFLLKVLVKNETDNVVSGIQARVTIEKKNFSSEAADIQPQSSGYLEIPVTWPRRGQLNVSHVRLFSIWPAGFFYSWAPTKLQNENLFIYPSPKGTRSLPEPVAARNLNSDSTGKGGEDFSQHKVYVNGDNLKRIDWKIYARNRLLQTKIFEDGASVEYPLKLKVLENENEVNLSQLSSWVKKLSEEGKVFSLSLNGAHFEASSGSEHFHKCMRALATYQGKAS